MSLGFLDDSLFLSLSARSQIFHLGDQVVDHREDDSRGESPLLVGDLEECQDGFFERGDAEELVPEAMLFVPELEDVLLHVILIPGPSFSLVARARGEMVAAHELPVFRDPPLSRIAPVSLFQGLLQTLLP